MEDFKERAKRALEKYYERQEPKDVGPKRKNKKPEKITEQEVCAWLIQNGFDYSVIEAKAVYNRYAGRYIKGQVESGFSDIQACTSWGHACYIELKARGRRSTLRTDQWGFLHRKISCGAFAVVVDSAERLEELYSTWSDLYKHHGKEQAMRYLYDALPKQRESKFPE